MQLYAAGTSGNGSTPQALLSGAVTTDATGGFTVPSGYTCPSSTATTYLLAEGGQVAGASSANSDLWLMAPIGACGDITASTTAVLNEVTTVASAWALSQFLAPEGNLGATSTNALGLANAVIVANNLVNIATGTSPGAAVPANVTVSTAKLNTLADALASCTTSAGETACAALLSAATPTGGTAPSNTLDAALNIARHPASNVGSIYTLAQANAIFPSLAAAPPDWLLYMTITGGGLAQTPEAIAIDSDGNVWVSTYFGAVAKFSPDGTPDAASGFTGYGINESYAMALDATGNVWIANRETTPNNGSGDVTELTSSGLSLSGTSGFIAGGIDFPQAIATDPTGNVWVANAGDSTVTLLNNSGVALASSIGAGSGLISEPEAIAVDSARNAWIGNTGAGPTITRISPDGSQMMNITCCDHPVGIAIDQKDNVWTANFLDDSISLITNSSAASPSVNNFTDKHSGLYSPNGIAVDGAGNVWVTNYYQDPGSLTELAGATASVPGAFLSPPDAGFGSDASMLDPYGIAIDASGNLWVSNSGDFSVTQFVGAAVPVKTPLVGPSQLP
ncbi:NHL repeat-containing protein [Granulicella mallensis]|uniref:Streptogramin lyase n=1 Tax=Granulicella mallensis TaxID=940614 RepID=A0A7W7ZQ95_9BACT|nr:NHL repeat-containing protein [Granulicella mallensis]MBB5063838.1 streptogramin lyase [Granulicella mallensis]